MKARLAPLLTVGLLVLAILACNPVPNVNIPAVSTIQAAATGLATMSGLVGTAQAGMVTAQAGLGTAEAQLVTAQATFAAGTPVPTAVVPADTLLPARLKAGQVKLDSLATDSNGSDFYGPILSLQLTNPSTNQVLVNVPCGLIFVPDDNSLQRLMVIQPVSATVGGKVATLRPFVICIDDSKHAPANASTYKLGNMATGDLLKLAACACTQPLSVNADLNQEFGLQVAVWHTNDPKFPTEITQSPLGPALQPMMPLFLASANGWLTKCGLPTIKP